MEKEFAKLVILSRLFQIGGLKKTIDITQLIVICVARYCANFHDPHLFPGQICSGHTWKI